MSKHLERDLDHLQRDLLGLAASVEEAISKATRSLQERDTGLADQVIVTERQIDQDEKGIEEDCLKMLALHQPVAIDLRRVASAMKINTELERMGDLAEEIAKRAKHLAKLPRIQVSDKLPRMVDLTTSMVRQSLDAFVHLDNRLARVVLRLDNEVNRYYRELIDELVPHMQRSPEFVEPGLSMFSVIGHLERIADHATNIAEDVLYIVDGAIARHDPNVVNTRDE